MSATGGDSRASEIAPGSTPSRPGLAPGRQRRGLARLLGGGGRGHTMRGRVVSRYLAVLATLLVVSAAFQYLALRRFLLQASAERVVAVAHRALLQYGRNGDALQLARAVADPRTAAWVVGSGGRLLAEAAPPFGTIPLSPVPPASGPRQQVSRGLLIVRLPLLRRPPVPGGRGRHRRIGPGGGLQPLRGPGPAGRPPYGHFPAPPPGGLPSGVAQGTLVLATRIGDVTSVLGAELDLLGLGGLAVLAAAGAVGAWVLGEGLRPLEEVAATADAVAAGDLAQRSAVDGAPQEVARVGRAFNAMLDRLSAALAHEQEAREQMRRLLADASHELRTPVTAIAGFLEVLRAGAARDPATLDRSLGTAHSQARRMALLVDQLLSLARLEQPAPLHLEGADLAAWLQGLRAEVEQAAGGHPVEWSIAGPDPVRVRIDGEPLARALLNLVENAAKYSPVEAPVEVGLETAGPAAAPGPDGSPAGPSARLTVADHGPGIPADERPLVFQRFRRGSAAQGGRIPGTGLGLAIVDAVARAHGGRVELESPPGGGTRASIVLPLEA